MIGRVMSITMWLILGEVLVSGLYWTFLNTPESNSTMLAASAVLILLMILCAGFALGAGILSSTWWPIKRAVSGAPWIIVAVIPPLVLWWLVGLADVWIAAHSGEIAAWFIARLGWADVSWLMRALDWLSLWMRGVVAPLLGISLFAALLFQGAAALGRLWWLGRALRVSTLTVATLALTLFVLLPSQAAYWQPRGLPPTWIEPTLAGLRLLFVGLAMTIGWAIVVAKVAARPPDEPPTAIEPVPTSNSSEAGEMTLE